MPPIQTDYRYIKPFRDYVDKYAKQNNITVQQALEHEQVRQVWRYYTEL